MRAPICNFRHPELTPSLKNDKRTYAHSADVSEGDLYRRKSCAPDDDLVKSELINEELPDSMSLYYEKVRDIDNLDFGHLLQSETSIGGSTSR